MMTSEKRTILIVDDAEVNRAVLADILRDEYEILEAASGEEAIALLQKGDVSVALMLLDLIMPGLSGYEVLAVMGKNFRYDTFPVIIISSENSPEYIEKGYEYGAADYISRPFDPNIVRRRVNNMILLHTKQQEMEGLIRDQVLEKERYNALMIDILSTVVEFRNGESGLHVIRIRIITELLLEELRRQDSPYYFALSEAALVSNAAALHDIGKIVIPEEILNKPGKLTPQEFVCMKTHSASGEAMLQKLRFGKDEKLVQYARQICRWHHERWDGGGYPDGLKGDQIPIAAQIVSLADVYDALVSWRVYKPAYSHSQAIQMILNGECGIFNPQLIQCLERISDHLEEAIRIQSDRPEKIFDINQLSRELIAGRKGKISDRTLFLLERERTKYQFIASLSDEVLFEYDVSSDTLSFSERCEKAFGISTVLVGVFDHNRFHEISPCIKEVWEQVKVTSPDDPIFKEQYLLPTPKDGMQWHEIIARSMWMEREGDNQLYGVIGRVANIHNRVMENKRLETMAKRDALTGLYHHTAAEEIIAGILQGDRPRGILIMFDIDNFKQINDTFGHQFGDRILAHIARLVKENIRKSDVAARIGGDEFLVCLNNSSKRQRAVERCEALWKILLQPLEGFAYSVSMGATVFPDDGTEYQELLYRADQALYASKRRGKNCYTCYRGGLEEFRSTMTPIER